ncbi:cation diffusion facilitator family transporter [Adhaeribacter radiodurans]|uniref:Cation transporter n=1 Tax=Adhaeribacter radiodurans TaxID=2745197 RepID=A0A7L7L5Y1_9BACT|nr:cation diffusion facilitator family transporter [Adhaeribacter radiodurans]QMU28164.1 cation transporter [Adhaeribacter radiodurans]
MDREDHKIAKGKKAQRTTLIGIGTSFLLVIVKGIAGIIGNSYALIADAIESLTDIFTSSLLLVGFRVASKPADQDHPYGHGKAEPITSLIVVLGLIVAATIIVAKSFQNLRTPHAIPEPFTLIVLIAVVIAKEWIARYIKKQGEAVESKAMEADAFHHRSDAITSAAAFIGITIALIGGKGYENADDYAALLASLIIYYNGFIIGKAAIRELMDEAPFEQFKAQIREVALKTEKVLGLDKTNVRKMGLDHYVDMHVIVNGKLTVEEGHQIAHALKNRLLIYFPTIQDVIINIEPN